MTQAISKINPAGFWKSLLPPLPNSQMQKASKGSSICMKSRKVSFHNIPIFIDVCMYVQKKKVKD